MKNISKKKKKYTQDFYIKNGIYDREFNIKEYSFLEIIFSNTALINKIYVLIDELLEHEKLSLEWRYLIIGDFLFSTTSYDLHDPANLIFKTTRSDYIDKIRLRAMINENFDFDSMRYIKVHKKLLIALRKDQILLKTEIRTKKNKGWETIIYFYFKLDNLPNKPMLLIGHSSAPFILREFYHTWYSIGSFRNIWDVKRKKREMVNFLISKEGVKKANIIRWKISKNLYNINKKIIEDEKNKFLEEIKCDSLENYFEKIKRVLEDSVYANNLFLGKEKIENVILQEIFILKIDINKEYTELMINFQKLISLFIISQFEFDKGFYIPCFMDNRGRQYYSSLISPTFYKIFRYLYEFDEKKELVFLEKSKFYKKIIKYRYLVENYHLDNKKSYMLLVLFIEVGKYFIKNDMGYIISTKKIIEEGINHFNKKSTVSFEDDLYLNKIYYNIMELINWDIIDENIIIFKDATASGLQNYGIMLGYNKDKLKYLNIDGDDWCDTYGYLIHRYLNIEDINFLISHNIFITKRKYWKSTIMTIPYNAVWYACFIKFIEALRKDKIEYNLLSNEIKNKIKIMHRTFYNDIKLKLKNDFYDNKVNNLKEFQYNEWIIVSKKDYKINYLNERDKYTDLFYMLQLDLKATLRAAEANNMHYTDSNLAREMLIFFEIMTIHDCFGIRLSELHLLMDAINNYYSKKIKKKTYNPHIFL